LIAIGYVLEIIGLGGFQAMWFCSGIECAAALGGAAL
jgi:hypothetical protein